MNTIKWTPAEESFLRTTLKEGNSLESISKTMMEKLSAGEEGFVAPRTAKAIKSKCHREGLIIPSEKTLEEVINGIEEITTKYNSSTIFRDNGTNVNVSRKILSISDIHFPLTLPAMLNAVLHTHKDADIVVVNGDLLEGYNFSTFSKSKLISALDEYRSAFEFIKLLATTFPEVVLVSGNHDVRAARSLASAGFTSQASQVFRPDLMARIANGEELAADGTLTGILDFSNVHYQQNESWYVKIGKTLFIHPHTSYGGTPGTTVRKTAQRLMSRYSNNEVDSFVCGHTHQIYKAIINNQLLIEQGCLTGCLEYGFSPRSQYLTNAQNGYAVIYQDKDGNTDFNLSSPIYLGEALPPKKSLIF